MSTAKSYNQPKTIVKPSISFSGGFMKHLFTYVYTYDTPGWCLK